MHRCHPQGRVFRQLVDRIAELFGQVPAADNAITLAIKGVLAAPIAEHHFGMVEVITVDRDVGAVNGKGRDAKPVGIDVVRGLTGRALAEEDDVGDDRRAVFHHR